MVALLLPTTRSNRRVHSGFYLLLGFSYSVYEWILYAKNHKLQLSIRQKAVLITTNFMFYTLPYRSFPSPGHWLVITYSLSSVVLFHATLFEGVPCVPSVAQILHQVGAFGNFEIL